MRIDIGLRLNQGGFGAGGRPGLGKPDGEKSVRTPLNSVNTAYSERYLLSAIGNRPLLSRYPRNPPFTTIPKRD